MRLVVPPGVFRPRSDTRLLASCARDAIAPGAAVADICTGSGYVAVAAGLAGAGRVTAVDVSRRAAVAAWVNGGLNGVRVEARAGDLLRPLESERFDLIVSNPPYLPSETADLPARGQARAWEGGRDGRTVIDRICAGAPERLRPRGSVLLVHSDVCGIDRTLAALERSGLEAEVIERRRGPLGPLLAARAEPGRTEEEIAVIRGRLP